MPVNCDIPAGQLSPNVLAFVGDAVFGLYIRTRLARCSAGSVQAMHKRTTDYVKAAAQAMIAKKLFEHLSEEEQSVFRRGRNAKSTSIPKHAIVQDYRHATGFEALIGWLHLTGSMERLDELLEQAAELIEEAGNNRQDVNPDANA